MFSSSPIADLLQRFLLSLFGLRRLFPAEISLSIDEYRQLVGWAPPALAEISAMLVNDALVSPPVLNNRGNNNNMRYKGKQAKRSSIAINAEPFKKLDVSVPNTKQAAQQLATNILQDLKRVLEVIRFFFSVSDFLYNNNYL